MSKRIDFPKHRRTRGRALSTLVHQLKEVVKTLPEQQRLNAQASLAEAASRNAEERLQLAERLQQSVVPLYTSDERGRPDGIGSCVLVRVDSGVFAFTAAHVIRAAGSRRLWAPAEGKGGDLLPLPSCTAHLSPVKNSNDLDVGVLVLRAGDLGAFERRVFLTEAEIDQADKPDAGLEAFYLVVGYPASRTQVKVSRKTRHIDQKMFHCATSVVAAAEYLEEEISQSDHILLDFDHKEIVAGGTRINPPKLHGISGGGVFHVSLNTNQTLLTAIATRNPRKSRLIVGTRLKHFLAMVRELKYTYPNELLR